MDIMEGFVAEEDSSFHTRTFLIRYCDEEVELNDYCVFRAEVNLDENQYLNTEFFLECDLYFVDLSKLESKQMNDQISEVVKHKPLKKVTSLTFKCLKVV